MNSLLWQNRLVHGVGFAFLLMVLQHTQAAADPLQANVVRAVGSPEYQVGASDPTWRKLSVGMNLAEGAFVRSGKGGLVDLTFPIGAMSRLEEGTDINIHKLSPGPGGNGSDPSSPKDTGITMTKGLLVSKVNKLTDHFFHVDLPCCQVEVVCGESDEVSGTLFAVSLVNHKWVVRAVTGSVVLRYANTQITVPQGHQVIGICLPQNNQALILQPPHPVTVDPAFTQIFNPSITKEVSPSSP